MNAVARRLETVEAIVATEGGNVDNLTMSEVDAAWQKVIQKEAAPSLPAGSEETRTSS